MALLAISFSTAQTVQPNEQQQEQQHEQQQEQESEQQHVKVACARKNPGNNADQTRGGPQALLLVLGFGLGMGLGLGLGLGLSLCRLLHSFTVRKSQQQQQQRRAFAVGSGSKLKACCRAGEPKTLATLLQLAEERLPQWQQ
ncbi:hypothetical protein AWZ03_003191 [Drosophila navojoa]|uniref:Protein tweety homolog n=1 Tax=Drosophila navojoa TaxID=7232 RepID=A0A484BN41_DRONA|nr:hypothetical protein AWZ03_003191 [Drosophila navojoa]